ncbi:hypothetical protein E2C01_092723 [Portunus trituberculatus]|uniref:Uncharacterized protein n=1 Tax=Portunus trituberculatus TaxID=210409 RepID=A0A5B7JWN2_PORTR|nr:hypothetical protein [Portunus trituberculatus]
MRTLRKLDLEGTVDGSRWRYCVHYGSTRRADNHPGSTQEMDGRTDPTKRHRGHNISVESMKGEVYGLVKLTGQRDTERVLDWRTEWSTRTET